MLYENHLRWWIRPDVSYDIWLAGHDINYGEYVSFPVIVVVVDGKVTLVPKREKDRVYVLGDEAVLSEPSLTLVTRYAGVEPSLLIQVYWKDGNVKTKVSTL